MGQNSSKRRSFTPGTSKNTEIATPPLDNGENSTGTIRVQPERDSNLSEEKGVYTSGATTSAASSSTPKGKSEKRKRFRVSFPIRRTASGRWSRKKKRPSQNGVRSKSSPNPNDGGQVEMTERDGGWTVFDLETQENRSHLDAVDFHDYDERKSEPKSNNKPTPKPAKLNKGSQRSSGKNKKKNKENSKKEDKKKKTKQSLEEAVNVVTEKCNDETPRELEGYDPKESAKGALQEIVVVELEYSKTPYQERGIDIESVTSTVNAEAATKLHEHFETPSIKDSSELPARHKGSPFTSFNTPTVLSENTPTKLETERGSKIENLEATETGSELADEITKEIKSRAEKVAPNSVNSNEKPELYFLASEDTLSENANNLSLPEGNYVSMFTGTRFSATEQTEEANSLIKEPKTGTDDIEILSQNLGASNDTFEVSSQNLGASNDTFGVSSQNLGASNDTFGVSAENLGASNDTFGVSSQNVDASNDTLRVSSQNLGASNDTFGVSFQNLGVNSDTFGVSSQNLGTSTDKFRVSSQNLGVSNDTFEISSKNVDECNAMPKVLPQNLGAGNDTSGVSFQNLGASNDTSGVSLQNLGPNLETVEAIPQNGNANNEASIYPDSLNYSAGKDVDIMDNSIRASASLEDLTPQKETSPEENNSDDKVDSWSHWDTMRSFSDDIFQFKSEDTQQMKAGSSDMKSFVEDEIQYEEMGIKTSHETESQFPVTKEHEELVTTSEVLDGKTDYEDVELKVNAIQEVEINHDNSVLLQNENKEAKPLEGKQVGKEKKEKELKTMSTKERNSKKQNRVEKMEKSKPETLLNIPKKLSNWFHRKDDQKNVGSVEIEVQDTAGEESVTELNKDQVIESTLWSAEHKSPELTTYNSTFPDKPNLTLEINKTPLASRISTESSTSSDGPRTSTSLSPTSPTSYSGRVTSPTSDGEKSDGSNFLKRISLGSRLRTAILRKKSSDASDNSQEVRRVSLTQPKTVEFPDLTPTPPSRKLHPLEPEVHFSVIEVTSNDAVFSNDTCPQSPTGESITSQEFSIQSKSVDSSVNDADIADLTSPKEVKPEECFEYRTNFSEEITNENVTDHVSCMYVGEPLTYETSIAKEKSESLNTNDILFDSEDEECPLLDQHEDSDDTELPVHNIGPDSGNDTLYQHNIGIQVGKTASCEQNIGINTDKAALYQQNIGICNGKTASSDQHFLIEVNKTALYEPNCEVEVRKTALYEPNCEVEVDTTVLSSQVDETRNDATSPFYPKLGLSIDATDLVEPEVNANNGDRATPLKSPRSASPELFTPNFLISEKSEQTTLQKPIPAIMSHFGKSEVKSDKNNVGKTEFSATPDSANSKLLSATADELPFLLPPSSMSSSAKITEDCNFASIQHTTLETSVLLDDEHKNEHLETPYVSNVSNAQIGSLPGVLQQAHEGQSLKNNLNDYDLCSEKYPMKIIQKDDYLPARTIVEYQIGVNSDLLEDQLGFINLKEDQTGLCEDFQTTNGHNKDHLSNSAIKETDAVPCIHQCKREETSDILTDIRSAGNLVTSESIVASDFCYNSNGEITEFNQKTSLASLEMNNNFKSEDTTNTHKSHEDDIKNRHVTSFDNGMGSHFEVNGDFSDCAILSGRSKNVNHSESENHQDGINGKEETVSGICRNPENGSVGSNGTRISQGNTVDASLKLQYSNNNSTIIQDNNQHQKSCVAKDNKEKNPNIESADV